MGLFSKPKTPTQPFDIQPMQITLPNVGGAQLNSLPPVPQIQTPQPNFGQGQGLPFPPVNIPAPPQPQQQQQPNFLSLLGQLLG